MSAPFFWIFFFFASGILAAGSIEIHSLLLVIAGSVAAIALAARNLRLAYASLALFYFLIGALAVELQKKEHKTEFLSWVRKQEGETASFEGIVVRTPEIADDYFVVRIRITAVRGHLVEGNVRLTVSGPCEQYPVAGDVMQSYARFRLARNFRAEGSFQYERYLEKERIQALGSVKDCRLLHKTGHQWSLRRIFSIIRIHLIANLQNHFSSQEAGLLRALWLDDRSAIGNEMEAKMIDAGVFHAVAISGFHVAVLLWFGFLLLRRFLNYRSALLVLIFLLLFYFLLLEGRSSITRSFLTFLILAGSYLTGERIRWANLFFCSAFLQLALNPLEIYDAGYHLTYLATGAILFLAVPVCSLLPRMNKIFSFLLHLAITSLCIQLVLTPYQAYVFHKIPFASMIANFVVVPVSSVLIALGLPALPVIPLLRDVLAFFTRMLLRIFFESSELFSEMWLHLVQTPPFGVVVVCYLLIAGIVVVKRKTTRMILLCALAGFYVWILTPHDAEPRNFFRAHFIDVGQGDAILLEYPDGTFDLVDGGGFWNPEALDTGRNILLPYMSHWKVSRFNRVFLTHAHADHMNGLLTLLRYIPAKHFLVSRRPYGDFGYQRLVRDLPIFPESICAGKEYNQAGVKLRIVAPENCMGTLRVANDDSLVISIEFQGRRLLLTGDTEARTEVDLFESADVIKVPHHGSNSSSTGEFLDRIKPRVAVVMVGKGNMFGHPHPAVVRRYRERHILLYQTDLHGTVRISFQNGQYELELYQPPGIF